MAQFKNILGFELKYYFKNKIFIGTTVLFAVLIAAVMFFPRVAARFQSDTADTDLDSGERPVMLVKVADGTQKAAVQSAFSSAFADYTVSMTDADTDTVRRQIADGKAECAFVLSDATAYTYYVNNLSLYDVNTDTADAVLRQLYQVTALIDGGLSAEEAAAVLAVPINSEVESLGVDQAQNFFYTYIMIFALYMVILLYGQMVATNVATEKSSRAMELLITSADPTSMMFGKVIASCVAGLVQLVAIFGSALVFYRLNQTYWGGNQIVESLFRIPPALLLYMLLFFVLGFLVYAFLFGAVGSTASKLEDINTSVMPITLLFVAAFCVVTTALGSGEVDTPLMKVCSYIPFTSPMSMFTRIAMSTVSPLEIGLSVAILAGSVVGIGVLSAKIYRVGVLMYGTPPKIGQLLKMLKKA